MTEKSYRGTAIKDRTPENILDALKDKGDVVQNAALALNEYATKNHLGLGKLSGQTDVAPGVLSQFFNGTYNGNFDSIAEKINKFFFRIEQREKYGGIREFVETAISEALFALADKTRVIRRIQVVQSPEQVGKSTAFAEYTRRNNSGRTAYTSLSGGSQGGLGDFTYNLADQFGIGYNNSLRQKKLMIRHKLEACDLIIIDEFHLQETWTARERWKFFDYLRTDIHADGARGVLLVATNQDVMDSIRRLRKDAGYNIGQLMGRMRNEIFEIDPFEDILPTDIKALAKPYGFDPGADLVAKLHRIAQEKQMGHLGLIKDILNESYATARAAKRAISDEIVGRVASRVMSALKQRKELYS